MGKGGGRPRLEHPEHEMARATQCQGTLNHAGKLDLQQRTEESRYGSRPRDRNRRKFSAHRRASCPGDLRHLPDRHSLRINHAPLQQSDECPPDIRPSSNDLR